MKTLFKTLFIDHWPRKLLSLILAIIIFFVINKSLTTTKTITNVPVRIENIPAGKTVEGLQSNGFLNKKVSLTLSGNRSILENLNTNDVQAVIDATGKDGEWIATITKNSLRFENSEVNIAQGIRRVSQQNFIVKLTKIVSDKIPIILTQPIGEPPSGYQFIDIWPYQLYMTVSGPEEVVKSLKAKGIRHTFNLNDITKTKLDVLRSSNVHSDVVSFFVPDFMKQIPLPLLSPSPLEINDPDAKHLRIDFLRFEKLKLSAPLPVTLYFPPNTPLNPAKVTLTSNHLIENKNGIKMITEPLFVRGVSSLFLNIVKDRMEIAITVNPNNENMLDWSVQFINPRVLEEKYIHAILSDTLDPELQELQPHLRDSYLRNRFRNYMNQLQLYKSDDSPLKLSPSLQGNVITLKDPGNEEA